MKKRWMWFATVPVVGAIVAAISPSHAFDHGDSPVTVTDNAADIADVYSFMRPEPDGAGGFLPSSHLVMIMNVAPGAKIGQTFDSKVDYVFRVREVSQPPALALVSPSIKVICNFTRAVPQQVVCNAGGTITTVDIEGKDAGAADSNFRVFAGVRSDPAFADVAAFRDSVATGTNKFKSPGTNTFQGANVMSIVVEINVTNIIFGGDAGAGTPIFAVSDETKRSAL